MLGSGERKHLNLTTTVDLGSAERSVPKCESQRKAEAARRNGKRPPRVGSRPRGRPPLAVSHRPDYLPDGPQRAVIWIGRPIAIPGQHRPLGTAPDQMLAQDLGDALLEVFFQGGRQTALNLTD